MDTGRARYVRLRGGRIRGEPFGLESRPSLRAGGPSRLGKGEKKLDHAIWSYTSTT